MRTFRAKKDSERALSEEDAVHARGTSFRFVAAHARKATSGALQNFASYENHRQYSLSICVGPGSGEPPRCCTSP